MNKTRPSLDGFVPRQASTPLGSHHATPTKKKTATRQRLHTGDGENAKAMANEKPQTTLGTSSIRQSLEAIDEEEQDNQPTRRERRRARKERRKKAAKPRRIFKKLGILLLIIVIGIGAFLGIKALMNMNRVFDGGILGLVQKQKLKEDANGRSNFLIFGTEAPDHPGGNLTDSMMVLSINQTTKDAFMISLPRDLWVQSDYSTGKLNEVYFYGSDDGANEPQGAASLQKTIGGILGLDIQYYVHLNFESVKEIVDAVGGVTVTIESNPRGDGILDRNFDWMCNYQCYYVKYDDGQVVELDGEHALALARARNAQGGYGLSSGNFDREKNQQKIMKALREKALTAGTLTNLGKVTALMDALGNNFVTNVDTKEIQTLMTIASEMQTDQIRSLTLNDSEDPLVTTGMVGSASVVLPTAGLFNYSAIRAYIQQASASNPASAEGAKITILNGSGVEGAASREADKLKSEGFTISSTDNAPEGSYAPVTVYKIGEGNPLTTQALEKQYGVLVKTTPPPVAPGEGVSFVIILGAPRE